MPTTLACAVIIPARDEQASIAAVVTDVRTAVGGGLVECLVVDNGSRDRTAEVARAAGARVVAQPRPGYGWACRAGLDAVDARAEVIVFIDGDGSMPPEAIPGLVAPITAGSADVVCGIRDRGAAASAMPAHQRVGNRVIALMLLRLHGVALEELGPFRAVRRTTLDALDLPGSRYAWPAQLLARAARSRARIVGLPVGYRPRTGGRSKVGGSLRGSLAASWDIARVLVRERRR